MTQKKKFIAFREEEEIVDLIDDVVSRKGIDRSDFIREAIRIRLANLSFLSEETKKALGIMTQRSVAMSD